MLYSIVLLAIRSYIWFQILATGKRSNRWSVVTIRMGKLIKLMLYMYEMYSFLCVALAVFVRSPAAYEALKGFGLLQLPSRATLQAYTGAFLDSPGMSVCTHTPTCTHAHTHTHTHTHM